MRSGSTRRSIRSGRRATLPAGLPVQGNLDPLLLLAGGDELERAARAHPRCVRRPPARVQPRPRHRQGNPDRACRAAARGGARLAGMTRRVRCLDRRMQDVLAMIYLWLKAGHIIFVIFWMAGLFMLPRLFVYHQETEPGSPENALWIERERKLLQDHPDALDGRGLGARARAGLQPSAPGARLVPRQAGAGPRPQRLPRLSGRLCREAGEGRAPA